MFFHLLPYDYPEDIHYSVLQNVIQHTMYLNPQKPKLCIDTMLLRGHAVAQLVEALRYKPEGRGFDSRYRHLIFFFDVILPAALWPSG